MSSKSIDILAKLLSKENLTVVRVPRKTASFDVFSRILEIPISKTETPHEVEEMFICHEVGHALYTPKSAFSKEIIDNPTLKSYWNIIEDIRIEKMVKVEYPGTRRTFLNGYKLLVSLRPDFFGKPDPTDLFIDRINTFYKCGPMAGVEFTDKEWKYLERIEKNITSNDVVRFAKELYALAGASSTHGQDSEEFKDLLEKLIGESKSEDTDESEAEESESGGTIPSKGKESADSTQKDPGYDLVGNSNISESDSDEEQPGERDLNRQRISLPQAITPPELEDLVKKQSAPAPKSQVKFDTILEDLVDTKSQAIYLKLDDEFPSNPIIPYKTILKDIRLLPSILNSGQAFRKKVMPSVNIMVKEFEMRKSADIYRKTTIAKTGSLNINKLHAYKLIDDIFKNISVAPTGKNHGMIFLLDWSGSMSPILQSTIEQMISLVLFCDRVSIPYKVLAFTNSYGNQYSTVINQSEARFRAKSGDVVGTIFNGEGTFNLLEFLSSDMTTPEFNRATSWLLNRPQTGKFALGSTPLDASILYMRKLLPKFKVNNDLEKVSLVILTDGESDGLGTSKLGYYPEITNGVKQKYYIKHRGRDYQVSQSKNTDVLIEILKSEIDVSVLSFFITDRVNSNGIRTNADPIKYASGVVSNSKLESKIEKELKETGLYINRDFTARDAAFLIPQKTLKIKETKLSVLIDGASVDTIAQKFTESSSSKIKSKVLLREFIKEIA